MLLLFHLEQFKVKIVQRKRHFIVAFRRRQICCFTKTITFFSMPTFNALQSLRKYSLEKIAS